MEQTEKFQLSFPYSSAFKWRAASILDQVAAACQTRKKVQDRNHNGQRYLARDSRLKRSDGPVDQFPRPRIRVAVRSLKILHQRLLTLTVILKLPYWDVPHTGMRSCDRIANLQRRYAQKELNALLVENDIE